ncbi:unnamed protein product [Rhodiola kirilowii]
MSSLLAAGAASSSVLQRKPSLTTSSASSQPQKTSFNGLTVAESKKAISTSFGLNRSSRFAKLGADKTGLVAVTARTAGAAKNIEVEVDKPLGLTLGQKSGGGVVITAVENGGNAAKAGLKAGDQVIYTSSFFGDELWPADKLGFTKTAIQAKPDSVYFVISRGADVDVKRLPKRPAPPRFGRKLTDTQKVWFHLKQEPLTFVLIVDSSTFYQNHSKNRQVPIFLILVNGEAYTSDANDELYSCPQCLAPKKRFAKYDVSTGKAIGGGLPPIGVIIGLIAGLGAVGALLVYGLQ